MTTAVAPPADAVDRIADRLARTLGPQRYRMWFDRTARLALDPEGTALNVTVPNRFVADWIERHFHQALARSAAAELGAEVAVALSVDPAIFDHAHTGPASHQPRADHPLATEPPPRRSDPIPASANRTAPRSPDLAHALRHRLDDFVVGPSNQLAFAAARRLAEESDDAQSPLFIHGGVGLGKTHLLQGLCRRVIELRPSARVLYTTGEQFTNHFIQAVRANRLEAFRRRVRRLDLLAVDDVHFLADKDRTQQEFLHSFDAIELGGARVALASDCHPHLIEQFSEALRSRCVRGMVVAIQSPDTDTRTRIVRSLAERRGIPLMETVVAVLASRCRGSVREIEGTLTKLHALAHLEPATRSTDGRANGLSFGSHDPTPPRADRRLDLAEPADPLPPPADPHADACADPATLQGHPLDPHPPLDRPHRLVGHALVNRLLDEQHPLRTDRAVTFENILTAVAAEMGLTERDLRGPSRRAPLPLARALIAHACRKLTPMSFPEIAAALGRSSHSTIIACEGRLVKQLRADPAIALPMRGESIALSQILERVIDRAARA